MKKSKSICFTIKGVLALFILFSFVPKFGEKQIVLEYNYTVVNTWNLPKELSEISGMVWLRDDLLACVQDEEGVIFIYDLDKKQITSRVLFAGAGDYEGIAIHENDAYVLRSDGVIFLVENFESDNSKTSKFETAFSEENNMESLALNKLNCSLLLAPKDRDLSDLNFKGMYEISLDSKKMNVSPSFKINMNDQAFESFRSKKVYKTFSPSGLAIHPKTHDIYVLDGKKPKLLILDKQGKLKQIHLLDETVFVQPESITFDAGGKLFIGNEGKENNATIIEVQLK
ncbi:MAG: hypothetical protein ACI9DK_001480 [Vicingaceae bacterium]|jgi:uncharacterized protein YjiK